MDKHPHLILPKEDSFIARFHLQNVFPKLKNVALDYFAQGRLKAAIAAAKEALTVVKYGESAAHKACKLINNALAMAVFSVFK